MTAMTEVSLSCNSSLIVDVQLALEDQELDEPPSIEQLSGWANLTYQSVIEAPVDAELTIRIVDVNEITQLNRDYRLQDKATNVLSFPFESLNELKTKLLGDVIICHQVIISEALEQQKSVSNHYAHMVVHGVLHLLGYDHQAEVDAQKMEALEISILAELNISDPYLN